jgi:hypothetical protein
MPILTDPSSAYEITVTYQPGAPPTHTLRKVAARTLPGLPLPGPAIPAPAPPTYRLDVVDSVSGALLYRRPYARPGYVEAYGADSEWTQLPAAHPQVLVTLIPYFGGSPGLVVVAYDGTHPWLNIQLPQQ